jgi:hypothetical protein
MAAPSRTTSLGISIVNPESMRTDDAGITDYELQRNKRKARLHAEVQKVLLSKGVFLEERVLRGFDGRVPGEHESIAENKPHRKKNAAPTVEKSALAKRSPLRRSARRTGKDTPVPSWNASPQEPNTEEVSHASQKHKIPVHVVELSSVFLHC